MRFVCPHCNAITEVSPEFMGMVGECYQCGATIETPVDGTAPSSNERAKSVAQPSKKRYMPLGIAILLVLGLVTTVYTFFRAGAATMRSLSDARLLGDTQRELAQIAEALRNYEADYGSLPPAVTRDDTGKAMHSWRVLLLPYLGEQGIYDAYDLDLPWDDQKNLDAMQWNMPAVYRHPGDANSNGWSDIKTPGYSLISGNGTLFPASGGLSFNQVTDPAEQTILVVESKIFTPLKSWTEPFDVDFGKMRGTLRNSVGNEIGGYVEGQAVVATIDGRVHILDQRHSSQTVLALITPNGGERLADDTLD
ncbi:MAG: DUF1559 domain-containing protein [Planctomycetota bacterium]